MFFCLIASLLMAFITIITKLILNPEWKFLSNIMIIFIILSIVFGIMCISFSIGLRADCNQLEDQYKQLTLYADTIQESDNEYVRFDFYSQVNEYNNKCKQFEKDMNSAIIGALGPKDWNENIALIEFSLRDGGNNTG
jgi:hypothetical protein